LIIGDKRIMMMLMLYFDLW